MKQIPKIAGEFLKIIEPSDGGFVIHWVNASGIVCQATIDRDYVSDAADWARQEIEKLQEELPTASSLYWANDIKRRIERAEVVALWPEMFKAYCRGESLDTFFLGRVSESERTRKAVERCLAQKKLHTRKGDRTIAGEAVTEYLSELKDNARQKKD